MSERTCLIKMKKRYNLHLETEFQFSAGQESRDSRHLFVSDSWYCQIQPIRLNMFFKVIGGHHEEKLELKQLLFLRGLCLVKSRPKPRYSGSGSGQMIRIRNTGPKHYIISSCTFVLSDRRTKVGFLHFPFYWI